MTCMCLLGIKVAAADFSAVSQDQYHHEIFCAAISYVSAGRLHPKWCSLISKIAMQGF